MSKEPCPTCDLPLEPHSPCRACAALAAFDKLDPLDYAGHGSHGYRSAAHFLPDPAPPRKGPRFLCLSDYEILTVDDIDSCGVDVVGEDRYGTWFGTDRAPCIVKGSGERVLFTLHGERLDRIRKNRDWTGYYLGTIKSVLIEVPDHVVVKYIETKEITFY